MIRRITITIYGHVQGVGFRHHCFLKARGLGIHGSIKNLENGAVEIEAEATERLLFEFLDWCRQGPDRAEVEKIDWVYKAVQGYASFTVITR